MKWQGAIQKKGTFTRLVQAGNDVQSETLYAHPFILIEGGRASEREQPFYTALAATPLEAEAEAFAVYQMSRQCQHEMMTKGPMLQECLHCQVQRRVPLVSAAAAPPPKAERRFFGLF